MFYHQSFKEVSGSFANVAGPPAYNVAYDSNLDGIDLGKIYANFGTIWQF